MSNGTSSLAFCPVLDEMASNGYVLGRTGVRFGMEGLSTRNNLLMLRNLQLDVKPNRSLETGLAVGGSCLAFTQTYKDLGQAPSRQHIAIDPHQRGLDEVGLHAVERAGLSGYLEYIEDRSEFALPQLVRDGAQFDLVYIDGLHLFENVLVDFFYCAHMMTDNGFILFDDSLWPGVKKVLQFIRTNCNSYFREVDLSPYRADGRSQRYKLAKLAGRVQMTGFQKLSGFPRSGLSRFVQF